mgnify:CR=1 FL=1
MIDYEKLEVYHLALQFVRETSKIRREVSKGNSDLIDQFKRASSSILLNIAEGAGKFKKPDMQRFYGIARGSAMECGALIDILLVLELLKEPEHQRAKQSLTRIIAILSALCRSTA